MKKSLIMVGSAVLLAGAITITALKSAPGLTDLIDKSTPTITPTATYTPTPTATYTPTSTPTPEHSARMLALRDDLANRIDEYAKDGIDTAVTVTDLSTLETINIQGDKPMQPGCTANLFALLMLMDEVEKGNINYADIQNSLAEGVAYSHPNKFADIFIQEYGSIRVGEIKTQEWMISHQFPGIYDHVPTYPSLTGKPDELTSNVVNDAFVRLYRGELFKNPLITEETENLLRDGIPGYLKYMLPEYIQGDIEWIMRKLGTFEDGNGFRPEIDCGIVQPLSERTYSICVFTAGGTSIRDTRRGTGSYVIADLSEIVLKHFQQ